MTNINEIAPENGEEMMQRLEQMARESIDRVTRADIARIFELLPSDKRDAAWKQLTDMNALSNPRIANLFLTEYGVLFFVENSIKQIEQVNVAYRKSLATSSKSVVADVQQEMRVEGSSQVQAIREAGEEVTAALKGIQTEIEVSIKGVLDKLGTLEQLEANFGAQAESIKGDLEAIQTAIKDGPEKMAEAARLNYANVLYKDNAAALASVKDPIVEHAKGELRKFFSDSVDERNWRQNFKAALWGFAGSGAALVLFSIFFASHLK
ncbi:hypothetical protein [Paraburkholderia aromaticivorans]|uniref:hypothetical protein n=1 Tax=Paraburkholderia aromaticivorans TaxID=2026199 RepID=UPI0038BC6CB3